jgi:hypothetical protein
MVSYQSNLKLLITNKIIFIKMSSRKHNVYLTSLFVQEMIDDVFITLD